MLNLCLSVYTGSFAYLPLFMLDFIMDGPSGGLKAIDWAEIAKSGTQITVLIEIDGFSIQCFKYNIKLWQNYIQQGG